MASYNVTQGRSFNRSTTAEQVLEGINLSGKTVLITGANNGIGKLFEFTIKERNFKRAIFAYLCVKNFSM